MSIFGRECAGGSSARPSKRVKFSRTLRENRAKAEGRVDAGLERIGPGRVHERPHS